MAAHEAFGVPSIKLEQDARRTGKSADYIKPETDSIAGTPIPYPDEDIYEDAGDLDFTHIDPQVWLMRLPKYLWENWSKYPEDEEIKLGTLRLEKVDQAGKPKDKFTLLLAPNDETKTGLPREYNVDVTNDDSNNTFIFTEKDLPGFKPKGRGAGRTGPPGGIQKGAAASLGVGAPRWEKGRARQPYYKRAIPKQTALIGVVKHEMSCVPINAVEESRYLETRAKASLKPRETVFLAGAGVTAGNLLNPGTIGDGGSFSTFIKTAKDPKRAKVQEQKTARIPQNELFDLIYDRFEKYAYWPFKALKKDLNQPEQYLKETLEVIAELVKTGRFAMTWTLKEANKINKYANLEEEVAPEAPDETGTPGGDTGVDDEDDEQLEDVMP